nr:ankyrin repeat domain-containing protein SOWAHA-like [Pogona vitticeps]
MHVSGVGWGQNGPHCVPHLTGFIFPQLEPERDAFNDGGGSPGPNAGALETLEKEWLQGAASGHLATLKDLLQQDPTLATRKDFISGFTALHWAAKHGREELVVLLLEAGADVNVRAHGGYTPLHVAALHGHQHLMELLIGTFGAGQNIRDYSGHLAMHYLRTEASDRAPATPQLGPTRGERTRNRKRACLLLPKNSSGRPRRPWGSASDLAEEKPDQEGWREGGLPQQQQQQQQPPEQGKAPGHLSLPPSYRPVRKFSR